jgi:hypothetical protein
VAFLVWVRESSVCTLIRESESVWGYPTILFMHTLGMSILVGFVVVIDLRLLGVGRTVPLAPLKRLMPLIWIGFWISEDPEPRVPNQTRADRVWRPRRQARGAKSVERR